MSREAKLAGSFVVLFALAACYALPVAADTPGKVRAVALQLLEDLGITSGGVYSGGGLTSGGTITGNLVVTGTSHFADGTVTAPGVAAASDPDTGIYWTSGAIRIAVGGAQRIGLSGTQTDMQGNTNQRTVNVLGRITDQTGSYTLGTSESGTTMTDIGSTGVLVGTLRLGSSLLEGSETTFVYTGAASEFQLTPNAADKLVWPDLPGLVDGEYATTSDAGASVTVQLTSADDWYVTAYTGTWTEETGTGTTAGSPGNFTVGTNLLVTGTAEMGTLGLVDNPLHVGITGAKQKVVVDGTGVSVGSSAGFGISNSANGGTNDVALRRSTSKTFQVHDGSLGTAHLDVTGDLDVGGELSYRALTETVSGTNTLTAAESGKRLIGTGVQTLPTLSGTTDGLTFDLDTLSSGTAAFQPAATDGIEWSGGLESVGSLILCPVSSGLSLVSNGTVWKVTRELNGLFTVE